ncbi:SCO family protein [Nitrincola sp. MINF-07-Sa-05]|uniref:SCO family protein n=1 Tax=Nitrincola salilacus TaxID=3400273 RepID=UPI0039181EF0
MMNVKQIIFFVCLLALAIGGTLLINQKDEPSRLSTLTSSSLGGDFTLHAATGPVSLSDYEGKVVLLFMGFTHCPDICPTSLAVMTQALDNMSEAEADQVQGLFISVDPERDTPEHLAEYVAHFSPRITGITGSKEELDKVVRQYGAFYRIVETPNSAMSYTVDHTARIYLIDKQGKMAAALQHTLSPDELATAIKAQI